jgi:hypothetical protein
MQILETDKIESANLKTYLEFVKKVEKLSVNPDDYKDLIHEEVEFRELPNLISKTGQIRNFESSLAGMKKAKMMLPEQKYEIVGFIEDGDKITVEKIWTGRLALDAGNFKKGQELKAYICAVVEFKDGKIYKHRSYDCYEPFE